jgi:hypothetical protein
MGHSLAARFQLSQFYVGDLPMVEQIGSNDSEDSTESDDEARGAPRCVERTRCIVNRQEVPSPNRTLQKDERPEPLIRRRVPNRYRRAEGPNDPDFSSPNGPGSSENLYRPAELRTAYSWRDLLSWRIILYLGWCLLCTFFALMPRFLSASCKIIMNRHSVSLISAVLLAIFWCVLLHKFWMVMDFEEMSTITSRRMPVLWIGKWIPPPEHDPGAVLYF